MAATAHAHSTARAPARRTPQRPAPAASRRATASRRRAAARTRATRLVTVFVIALASLGVGRVALSFAVVQKTMETEAVAARQRHLASANAELAVELTRLSSTTRIRALAERELGLRPSTEVRYVTVPRRGDGGLKLAER